MKFVFWEKFLKSFSVAIVTAIVGTRLLTSPAIATGVNVDFANASNYDLQFVGSTTAGGIISHNSEPVDIDADGKDDLLISTFGGGGIASVYIIYGSLLQTFTSGSVIDLSSTSNYNVRFHVAPFIGFGAAAAGDIDGDGKLDLAFNSPLDPDGGGTVWVILNTCFGSLSGTGNQIDMTQSSSYNFRFHSSENNDNANFGYNLQLIDVNNNGRADVIIGDPYNSVGAVHSGQLFVIFDTLLASYGGSTGNDLPLGTTSNFSVLFRRNGGNSPNFSYGDFQAIDLNSDGKRDLIIGSRDEDFSFDDSGSVYLIDNTIFGSLTGSGHIFEMTDSTSYTLRIDGGAIEDNVGNWIVQAADVTSDNLPDLVIAASRGDYNSRTLSGSVYIISNELFSGVTGTGNTSDLTSGSSWTTRIDGAIAGDRIGTAGSIADVNNDGKKDLLIGTGTAGNNSRSLSGSLYLIDQSLFALSGVGHTLDLSLESSYTLRLDGPLASSRLTGYPDNPTKEAAGFDANGDGQTDIFTVSRTYNSGNLFGALYVMFGFPNSLTISAANKIDSTNPSFIGTIESQSWLFPISQVEYQVNGSAVSGSWQNCSPTDGSFNSKQEGFKCQLQGLQTDKPYTIYIRAKDSQGFYTGNSHFSFQFTIGGGSNVGGRGNNENYPANYTLSRNAGPNYIGLPLWIPTSNDSGASGSVFISASAASMDLWVTPLKVSLSEWTSGEDPSPLPWAQGFNTYSELMSVNARSSFNGYPYLTADNFFSLVISYDETKLKGISPNKLKIAYFDEDANKWKLLNNPIVVNYGNHTLATTTKLFTTYVVVYPSSGASTTSIITPPPSLESEPSLAQPEAPVVITPSPTLSVHPVPKAKFCFLGFCW